ncbi:hypothetical protein [Pectobacterium carotovorum]|uniref:hypothetical protein n=1 Tax=Pectobacterium carotovorum TaxID=554 RepID=UPI002A831F23|nr:hypothetical protein [Pectobacterium carotovorum]MDY4376011.1 hypothetical protein [Pectobacterium carotovorum subsp. carotovorum]
MALPKEKKHKEMKVIKYLLLLFVPAAMVGMLFVFIVASGSTEIRTYTESEYFTYYAFTDEDIRNAPRISSNYAFEYVPGDGYAPSNAIIFNDTSDTTLLKTYLTTLGYEQQKRKQGEEDVWKKRTEIEGATFYIWVNKDAKQVYLTKVFHD